MFLEFLVFQVSPKSYHVYTAHRYIHSLLAVALMSLQKSFGDSSLDVALRLVLNIHILPFLDSVTIG